MPLCRECFAMLPEEAKFCNQCGQKREFMQRPPDSFLDAHTQSRDRAEAPWAFSSNAGQGNETLLSPELREQLLECFRNDRFEQLDEIVRKLSRDGHSKLSAALIHV